MKFTKYLLISILLLSPWMVSSATCSSDGYTIATINGVFTNEKGAIGNMEALKEKFGVIYNAQKIKYEYLLNPTHSGGVGDVVDSIVQKILQNQTVKDYDLIEMLNEASKKVKTQKLLLVAHSQGNFYANSFYDVVAGQQGGVPRQSIGVYSVATPSGRVAGEYDPVEKQGGRHLTSSVDKVIAGFVGHTAGILPPNAPRLVLSSGDDQSGHGFAETYLKHFYNEINRDISWSFGRLSKNTIQDENASCISPPKLSMDHVVQGVKYAITDPILNPVGAGGRWTLGKGVAGAVYVVNTTGDIYTASNAMYAQMGAGVASGMIAVGDTTINTTVAVGNGVKNGALAVGGAIGSFTRDAVTGLFSGNPGPSGSNTASVIGALQNPVTPSRVAPSSLPPPPPSPAPQIVITPGNSLPPPLIIPVPLQGSPLSAESGSMPKLVFVGSQNQVLSFGGSSPYQAPIVTEESEPVHEEIPAPSAETPVTPQQLLAPTLTVPQCAYSLATDGCLLATTSVRFEWSSVAGAGHYEISQNGTIATTTDTFTDIIVRDFSQYTLIVSAVDANGLTSATSSQAVFVATIPVAINEIAWMGTNASANDEWFEIKNNTPYTIDLTQWELNAKDGTPHVQLAGTIAPRGYLIFERTDDTNVSDVEAHQIYTGALGNAGEQINLSYASTTLDQTPEIADGAWAAGDNGSSTTTKKTMERYSSREDGSNPMNWGTNLGYVKNGTDADGDAISGTPGEQNSVSTLINRGEDITEDFTLTADEERYVLARGTNVSASSTLTIESGVNIVFLQEQGSGNEGRFYGRGAIEALGEKENPITFEGSDGYPDASIRFRNTSATSTFEYTHFENIHGIETENGSVHISNSEFVSTEGVSIEGDGASLIIENTVFASSTDTSIRVCCGASATVSSSTITNQLDDYGIIVYGGNLVVDSTTIENIPGRHGLGIYATHSVLSVSSSTIRNVKNEAIVLDDSVATITNTVIEAGEFNTGSNGIEIYGGETTISQSTISGFSSEYCAGVSIEDTETPVAITGGEIAGNSIGVGVDNADDVVFIDVSIHDNGDGPEDDVVIW